MAEADIHLRVGGPIDIGSVTRNGVSHVRPAVGVAAVHRHHCGVNHAGPWVYTLTASVRSRNANRSRRQPLPPLAAPQGEPPAPQGESPAPQAVVNRAARQKPPAPQGESPTPPGNPPAPPAVAALARVFGPRRPRRKTNRPRRQANSPRCRPSSPAPKANYPCPQPYHPCCRRA